MKLQNKIFKNASWIVGCHIIQALLNLVINMLTARYLGPSNFGLISYAMSVVAFVIPITYLGMDGILVQETVQNPKEEGKVFGTALLMSFASSIACAIGVTVFVFFLNAGDRESVTVCALYSLILLFQALELIRYWFQSHYLSKYVAVISLCAYVAISAYKIFLLATGKSIYWFAVSNAIDHMMIAVALLITYRKLGGQKLSFSVATARRMLGKSKYYILSGLMVTVFAQTDKIMLNMMIDSAATGYYTAAVTAAGMTSFVFAAIIDSMRPAILQAKTESEECFRQNMRRLYSIIIFLSLAQNIGMTLLAKLIIQILYGESYLPAVSALQIVVWYTTFSYSGPVRDIWILAKEKQRYIWRINLSGAMLNVILNVILIPVWGVNGVAAASLITQFFTNVILGFLLKPIRENNRLMLESFNLKKVWIQKI